MPYLLQRKLNLLTYDAASMLLLVFLLFILGCPAAPPPPPPLEPTAETTLTKVSIENWPLLFDDGSSESLKEAISYSLSYLSKRPPDRLYTYGPEKYTALEISNALTSLAGVLDTWPDPVNRTEALKKEFDLYRSVGNDGQGTVLFTGYYEPVLRGSQQASPGFAHPLYALPDDLVNINLRNFGDDLPPRRLVGQIKDHQVMPYPDREAIDFGGAILQQAAVLAYVADLVDAFFMHIQGSGQIWFADGRKIRLGYAGSNGRPYRSIGNTLLKDGAMTMDQMSMQNIRSYLEENPHELRRVLSSNPSYVFFEARSIEGGPPGAFGIPVTAGRSIALDRKLFPGLGLAFIKGQIPAANEQIRPFARFALNHDTGGAIVGPGRLDLFFGTGDQAGEQAGRMKYNGELFFLAPKR